MKSKRTCGGWRVEGGFVFHQESGADRKKPRKKRNARNANTDKEASSDARVQRKRLKNGQFTIASPFAQQPISDCLEDQAICYFLSECALIPNRLYAERHMVHGILVPLYSNASSQSALASIMSALSLRAFSHQPGREYLLSKSDKHYGQAVCRLNQALASLTEAKSDATLLTVLMLMMRETITMTASSVQTFRQHVGGAVEIVKLRGRDSFSDTIGLRLFVAVQEQMVCQRLIRAKTISEEEIENLWKVPPSAKIYREQRYLLETFIRMPALREKAAELLHSPMTGLVADDIKSLLVSIRKHDSQLSVWSLSLPEKWQYETVYEHKERPEENQMFSSLWPGHQHLYRHRQIAVGWNHYRVLRIICHSIIINCLERLMPPAVLSSHPEFENSMRVIQKLADAICHSIPYINMTGPSGLLPDDLQQSDGKTQPPCKNDGDNDMSNPLYRPDPRKYQPLAINIGGLGMIWHLNIVATLSHISQEQRKWARHQMFLLSRDRGVDHAEVLGLQRDLNIKLGLRTQSLTDMVPLPYEPYEEYLAGDFVDPVLGMESSDLGFGMSTIGE